MNCPLVSTVINNYNYDRFLSQAIDSALSQTYPNVEVIVVDDGSTDNSREVIASYHQRVIPVLKQNGGQASALNAGFASSRGEIICFLDADDVWFESKIQAVVDAASANPQAVLLYHQVQQTDSEGLPMGNPWPQVLYNGWIRDKVKNAGGFWFPPPTSAMCFRRSLLERIMDIPEPDFPICADAYLVDISPFLGPVYGIGKPLTLYRLHGNNYWNSLGHQKEEKTAVISTVQLYEKRTSVLNQTLERMGLAERVRLDDNISYQYYKRILGEGKSIPGLVLQALLFPTEPRFLTRLKMAVKLMLT